MPPTVAAPLSRAFSEIGSETEIAVPAIDEGDVVRAGAQNRSVGNHRLLADREVERDVREHPRKKLTLGILELASDPCGAGHRIDLWLYEIDAAIEVRARIRVRGNGCRIAGTHFSDLVLEYRGVDPHLRQISDREEAGVGLHVHVGQRVALLLCIHSSASRSLRRGGRCARVPNARFLA